MSAFAPLLGAKRTWALNEYTPSSGSLALAITAIGPEGIFDAEWESAIAVKFAAVRNRGVQMVGILLASTHSGLKSTSVSVLIGDQRI
jgi:hypothetical protein